jgi:dihydropteroate synthase
MSGWWRPLVRPAFDGTGFPLAGQGHLRFDRVERIGRGARSANTGPEALSEDALLRLTMQRPDLCGLTLERPRIMGIVNVTPDSFSDGGQHMDPEAAVLRAQAMAVDADFLDIGGESTRPGAAEVPAEEEIARTAPVIRAIRAAGLSLPISIDTRKAAVARAALDAGADMVNDVSALRFDPDMAGLVAEAGVPVCLMHSRATPETMQDSPAYDDVVAEVLDELGAAMAAARAAGIAPDRIVIDPGIGFAKTTSHNLALMRGLSALHDLGAPVLFGASRKRFIGTITGADAAPDRMAGSVATALLAVAQGAQILRVHDVSETAQAVRMWLAVGTGEAQD